MSVIFKSQHVCAVCILLEQCVLSWQTIVEILNCTNVKSTVSATRMITSLNPYIQSSCQWFKSVHSGPRQTSGAVRSPGAPGARVGRGTQTIRELERKSQFIGGEKRRQKSYKIVFPMKGKRVTYWYVRHPLWCWKFGPCCQILHSAKISPAWTQSWAGLRQRCKQMSPSPNTLSSL